MPTERKYIEVARIESEVSKIHSLLSEIEMNRPRLYPKTAMRYRNIEEQLIDSMELVRKICEFEPDDSPIDHPRLSAVKPDSKLMMHQLRSVFSSYSPAFGITQANLLGTLLVSWFSVRFRTDADNKDFRYRCDKIPEWIDGIILGYSKAFESNLHMNYYAEMSEWIESCNSSVSWAVPLSVKAISISTDPNDYTLSAVILERIVKHGIFSATFMPDKRYTIRDAVSSIRPDLSDEINLIYSDNQEFVKSLTKLSFITTSSFDLEEFT